MSILRAWHVVKDEYVMNEKEQLVARVVYEDASDEEILNRNTIVNAPDMFTLLKELIDLRGQVNYDSIIWAEAMALIKKIEG